MKNQINDNREDLTPDQLRRLSLGMHNRAGYYEECAFDFPRSKDGYQKQAEMCRDIAGQYEELAKQKENF